jgi:plasmid maintenance system antidote protein VapI
MPSKPKKNRHQPMTPEEFCSALQALGLNQVTATPHLGISRRTINSYANGRVIPAPVAVLLRTAVAFEIPPERWG